MRNVFRRTPSASMIVAVAALVLAASGTAVAAGSLVNGDRLIKKNSLSGNRLRNHTISGTQLQLSSLGKVPSAAKADHATTADSAAKADHSTTADSAKTATTATSATTATTAGTAGSAPIATLTYASTTVTVPKTSPGSQLVTVSCPSGTNVVGGGAQVSDETNGFVNDSYPTGKTGWAADIFNNITTPMPSTVTAICAPAAATAP